jgi:hypothetical protein
VDAAQVDAAQVDPSGQVDGGGQVGDDVNAGQHPDRPQALPPHPSYGPSAPARAFPSIRPDEGLERPVAVVPVAGTPYGLAVVGLPASSSGPASASLPLGLGSILVSFVVLCFGTVGAQNGWGPIVAGAFALPAVFGGVAATVLGRVGRRQAASAAAGRVTGHGVATAGIVCGLTGSVFAVLFFLLALVSAH